MSVEIERKFLVKNDSFKELSYRCISITQGFLNSDKNRVVRIRITDDKGFITIKGITSNDGTSRYEWEKEIELDEAKSLLNLCEKGVILKKRYLINHKEWVYEIDVFNGDNLGLVVAEVELKSKDEFFEKPDWLGIEVTGVTKYYNSELKNNPFKNWA
jgi:CYTH domain-containing protein